MPTLQQLPLAVVANPADTTLLDQDGNSFAVTVQTLLASTQPQLTLASGTLLGRVSIGPGGPEPVAVGHGLAISAGQLTADTTVVSSLVSPAFTGTPTAPTPLASDNSTKLATTAFVQSHVVPFTLPPATAAALGGIKVGSGLSIAPDGTTALNTTLPPVDASNALVTASLAGALPRRLADQRGETINVADLLGAKPTGQDASAAIVEAMAIAAAIPGSTIVLCQGKWNFASLTSGLLVPTSTTIKGAGQGQTQITWNDTGAFSLFNSSGTSANRVSNIHFEDFTVTGTWATNGNSVGNGQYPFILWYVDTLSFRNVCSQYSRVMGMAARNSTDITAQDCTVRYCGRDGINFADCARVTVSDCTVEHCDDDGIAAHSNIFDPWLVRRNIVVSNNRLFDCQGIKVLAARSFTIVGNVIDCCRTQGICVTTVAADGVSVEGETGTAVGSITGNIIVNIINRLNIDGLNQGNQGIIISGDAARPGNLGTIPGEANTAAGTVVDPYPYFDVDSNQVATATPGSYGIVIAGNFIGRTLPACNGSSINPVTGTPYNSWTDYGFGQMFLRSGLASPSLAENDLRGDAIAISGGVVRDVLITGNVIRGMVSGLALYGATRLENITFRGNKVIDCFAWGVLINTGATLRAYIEDNLFDLDPFFKHPNRGSHGTWLAASEPTGVRAQQGSGVFVRRNTFRNMCRDSNQASDTVTPGWLFDGNIIEADPSVTGFSTANKGVGTMRTGAGTLLCQTDSDPGSATFGTILTSPIPATTAQPGSGKWLVGHFVRNSLPTIAGGLVSLGWTRLSTSANNAAGTDWSQALAIAGAVGTSAVLAGPTAGNAVPTFRQLTAADIGGIANVPAAGVVYSTGTTLAAVTIGSGMSFSAGVLSSTATPVTVVSNTYTASGTIAITDNLALVNGTATVAMTLAAGGTDGHALTVKRFGAGAMTLTATIDGTAGTQVLMNSVSLKEAVTLAWNAGNATWLLL